MHQSSAATLSLPRTRHGGTQDSDLQVGRSDQPRVGQPFSHSTPSSQLVNSPIYLVITCSTSIDIPKSTYFFDTLSYTVSKLLTSPLHTSFLGLIPHQKAGSLASNSNLSNPFNSSRRSHDPARATRSTTPSACARTFLVHPKV